MNIKENILIISNVFGTLIWHTELLDNTLKFLLENQEWNENIKISDRKYW